MAWVLMWIAAGCGDATPGMDATPPDAGGSDAAMVSPVAPAPPVLPDLTPCPTGWAREVQGDGIPICEPFEPGVGLTECADDAGHVPGASGCEPFGSPCPADGFPDELPAGRPVLYVRAGSAGGDGSEASPFATIAEATASATSGTVIAVAVGEYDEEVALSTGVALVGACASGTIVRFDSARSDRGVINADGADVEIRDLTIGSSARPGLWVVGDGVSASVRSLVVDGAELAGVSVESGAHLDAERLVVRDTVAHPTLRIGRGLNVESGASAEVRGFDARNNVEFAAIVNTGASLVLSDATLAATAMAEGGANGGHGLGIFGGGRLDARRLVLADDTQAALVAFDEGSTATVEDLVVRRVVGLGPFGTGRAFDVENGASLSCTRCLLEEAAEVSAAVGIGASLTLTDSLVHRTRPRPDGTAGRGLTVQFGGTANLSRVAIVDNAEHGIVVHGMGSSLIADDLFIHRITRQEDGVMGRALSTQFGGRTTVRRASFGDVADIGVLVGERGSAAFEDLLLVDVQPNAGGRLGRGLNAQSGGRLDVTRGRIETAHQVGVNLLGDSTRAVLRDVIVRDVLEQPCAATSCSAFPGGDGLGAHNGAVLEAETFVVEDVALCGLFVGAGGFLDLTDGIVRGAQIGACVQSDAQDLAALGTAVHFVDNGTNLEATELPIPETVMLSE